MATASGYSPYHDYQVPIDGPRSHYGIAERLCALEKLVECKSDGEDVDALKRRVQALERQLKELQAVLARRFGPVGAFGPGLGAVGAGASGASGAAAELEPDPATGDSGAPMVQPSVAPTDQPSVAPHKVRARGKRGGKRLRGRRAAVQPTPTFNRVRQVAVPAPAVSATTASATARTPAPDSRTSSTDSL